ncbi:hypothetical protein B0H12DRAFT_1090798 [Mycena haematopus]|nr:hypothetical protein B0H12DRAFT_1090798 [Mycena haematopus]
MASPQKYNTRCFHFGDDGARVSGGFHSKECRFAHPNDPEWLTAGTSRKKPPKYSSPRYRDSRSRSPRRRSRSRSRSRTTSYRDQPSADPRMDPRRPLSSVPPGSPALSKPAFAPPPLLPPRSLPPPLPLPRSAPPPPPPPFISVPPPMPTALTASDAAPKFSTQEEMTVQWNKVLPLLATCVEARKAFQNSEKDLSEYESMLNSQRYKKLLTDADRVRVEQERAKLTAARDETSRVVTSSLQALKDIAWWPVGPNQDEGAAEKYREILRYAGDLHNTANKIYEVYMKTSNAASSGTAVAGPSQQRDSSDARPLKRRRLSNATDEAPALDAADAAEMEKMRERLDKLTDQVCDIQNDLHALQASNTDDITAQIDARMETLALDMQDNQAAGKDSSAELQKLEAIVTKTNKDMNESLGPEIVALVGQSEKFREQGEVFKMELEQQSVQFAAMQAQFDTFQTELTKDREALYTLSVTFGKLKEQQPPSPPALPLDFILAAIDEPIRDTVQTIVRPMVDDLDRELKERIAKQDAEMYGNLWGQIALTLKVVNAVSNVTPVEPVIADDGKVNGKNESPSQAAIAHAVP